MSISSLVYHSAVRRVRKQHNNTFIAIGSEYATSCYVCSCILLYVYYYGLTRRCHSRRLPRLHHVRNLSFHDAHQDHAGRVRFRRAIKPHDATCTNEHGYMNNGCSFRRFIYLTFVVVHNFIRLPSDCNTDYN